MAMDVYRQYTMPIYVPTNRQVTQARITKTQKGRLEKRLSDAATDALINHHRSKDPLTHGTGMLAQ
jgi:hypothetical protein